MEIVIENLCKKYGKTIALNNINLNVKDGMYGLLGANGAGKTTLIRILATVLCKSSGDIHINGIPIENVKKIRPLIGYLPQDFSLYPGFTVYECMDYFSLLSKVGNNRQVIYDLLEKVNMLQYKKLKVKSLSGGMKQRLGIAIALINKPKLLLVDEPTASLDPEERLRIRNMLTVFSENRTVILSTHIISDIEETCSNVAIINRGSISFYGSSNQLREKTKNQIWELTCHKDQLSSIMESNKDNQIVILSQIPYDNQVKLRLLSSGKPHFDAVAVDSKIEDSYMKIIHTN